MTIVRKIIVVNVLTWNSVINVTIIIAVDVQLCRNAKFAKQISVLAVGQIILVHVWELIVVIVSPSATFVQRLTAKTVLMERKMTSSSVRIVGNRLALCVGLVCRKSARNVRNYICLYNELFPTRGYKRRERGCIHNNKVCLQYQCGVKFTY